MNEDAVQAEQSATSVDKLVEIYIKIRDYSAHIRKDSEVKPVSITCASCDNEYEQAITLNPTDFFE